MRDRRLFGCVGIAGRHGVDQRAMRLEQHGKIRPAAPQRLQAERALRGERGGPRFGEARHVGELDDRAMECAVGGGEAAVVAGLGGEAQAAKAFERPARREAFAYA